MTVVAEVSGLTKKFGRLSVLTDVSFQLERDKIYGLLGRNGAGKSTLLKILAAQQFASAGTVHLFGEPAYENKRVLGNICLIKESQHYPDTYTLADVLAVAATLYPHWNEELALDLADAFALPVRRRMIRKYSRGMVAAVGIIVGLASRAPLTVFDEPYLGLDAVARTLFYERLLADYSEHPRTIVLSTHLIDEVSQLLEHVLIVDQGRLLIDEDAEAVRQRVMTVTGPSVLVAAFAAGQPILHREQLGDTVAVSIVGAWDATRRREAAELGLRLTPLSLQQLFVHLTTAAGPAAAPVNAPREAGIA